MIVKNSFFHGFFKFYERVYLALSVVVLTFVCVGLTVELTLKSPAIDSSIGSAGILLFSISRFYIWSRICRILKMNISNKYSFLSTDLKALAILFAISFSLDVMDALYKGFIYTAPGVNWKSIGLPVLDNGLPLFLIQLFQLMLKILVESSGFLTPTINGLPCLLIALVCYALYNEKCQVVPR